MTLTHKVIKTCNNPVNAVDPTGKVVIALDSISQRNLTLTLSPDDEQYVKFTDGVLDVSLLNESESDYENINALKALANSDTNYYVSMATSYSSNNEVSKLVDDPTKGCVGVTLVPKPSPEPSPDENVYIYVSSYRTSIGQVHTMAHETYGHAYFYELRRQGKDVYPFHTKGKISSYWEYEEILGIEVEVIEWGNTNFKLEKQIDIVSKQAEKFYKQRFR